MKYDDYYETLGVARDADAATIKKAYRKLAQKYHPDVSKEKQAEAKFKSVGEAYATLKDPEKRAAYDELGRHPAGEEFRPPPEWQQHHSEGAGSFDDIDLSDLFAQFGGAGRGNHGRGAHSFARNGGDFDVAISISLADAFSGTELSLNLEVPEYDQRGAMHSATRIVKVRIPKGATNGDRLRVPGKGGAGRDGGQNGDMYLVIEVKPDPLFRLVERDLLLDLPLLPWEAALGTSVSIPTLSGPVELTIPPGTKNGRKLRLGGRGLPRPGAGAGDLYAVVQLTMPPELTPEQKNLFKQLADSNSYNPRRHFEKGVGDGH